MKWVDGNDPEWQKQMRQYCPNAPRKGNGPERFRDWNQFMYWFRAVEKYAPWVRKVHVVTWGHKPAWLNCECEKLHFVTHDEFIPKKYLPTFSTFPIALNLFRIPGLSERYVEFDDDIYLSRPITPQDFFEGGLPKYCGVAVPVRNDGYNGAFAHQLFSVMGIINGNFDLQASVQQHPECWFSKAYGDAYLYNKRAYKEFYLPGLYCTHLASPYLKSTIQQVWEKIGPVLDETCTHKYRTPFDIIDTVFSNWDIMRGNFVPVGLDYYGMKFESLSKDVSRIKEAFESKRYRMLCLNDSVDVTEENFESLRNEISAILEHCFPEKSMFEK